MRLRDAGGLDPEAARPLVVVPGALINPQLSKSVDSTRFAFFGVALPALGWSLLNAWRTRDSALVDARATVVHLGDHSVLRLGCGSAMARPDPGAGRHPNL